MWCWTCIENGEGQGGGCPRRVKQHKLRRNHRCDRCDLTDMARNPRGKYNCCHCTNNAKVWVGFWVFCFSWDRVSPGSLAWPWMYYVAQIVLKLAAIFLPQQLDVGITELCIAPFLFLLTSHLWTKTEIKILSGSVLSLLWSLHKDHHSQFIERDLSSLVWISAGLPAVISHQVCITSVATVFCLATLLLLYSSAMRNGRSLAHFFSWFPGLVLMHLPCYNFPHNIIQAIWWTEKRTQIWMCIWPKIISANSMWTRRTLWAI